MATPSDEILMRRIQQSDAAAFDLLLDRHGPLVRQRLSGILRDGSATEDLSQEVFLRVWTRAGQWSGRGSVAGWLLRIATNLALSHLRSVRRRRQRPLEAPGPSDELHRQDLPWLADASAVDPLDRIARAEDMERLRESLEALPEEKRDVVRMVHEDQMDLRAVAEELGIPVGTVKSRLYHARKRLAKLCRQVDSECENI